MSPFTMKKKYPKNKNSIQILETFLKCKLPKAYVQFLSKTNGGVPEKSFFPYGEDDGSLLNSFFGITNEKDGDIINSYIQYFGIVPKNCLPIGDDQGGNILLMSVKGKDYGKIFFMDHEKYLICIADSFDEFISMLKSQEEIDALESRNKG